MFEIGLFLWIKMDLSLNTQQWLICHKTKPNQTIWWYLYSTSMGRGFYWSLSSSSLSDSIDFPDSPQFYSIAPGRYSKLHPVSALLAGRPTFEQLCIGVNWRTSLMSSSLLPQQCSTILVRLTRMICVMGSKWPDTCSFVWCCFQHFFKNQHALFLNSSHQTFFFDAVIQY